MAEKRTPALLIEDNRYCPGCGHGILMHDVAQAIDNLGLDKHKVCIVSGIGCSSRAAGYMDFDTIHTTHGRAIAFATGIKLANPELHVIVITGDGDDRGVTMESIHDIGKVGPPLDRFLFAVAQAEDMTPRAQAAAGDDDAEAATSV